MTASIQPSIREKTMTLCYLPNTGKRRNCIISAPLHTFAFTLSVALIFAALSMTPKTALAQTGPSVITTIPVGNSPTGVGVNQLTNRIYVANNGDSTVSVVDGNTNTVVATIPVADHPVGVAVNPTTNLVYVANKWSGNRPQ